MDLPLFSNGNDFNYSFLVIWSMCAALIEENGEKKTLKLFINFELCGHFDCKIKHRNRNNNK